MHSKAIKGWIGLDWILLRKLVLVVLKMAITSILWTIYKTGNTNWDNDPP